MSSVNEIRAAYETYLNESGELQYGRRVAGKAIEEPLTEPEAFHPDKEPELDRLNYLLATIGVDMAGLNTAIMNAATQLTDLATSIKTSLADIDRKIAMEQERLEDINMLTGFDNGADYVLGLSRDSLSGNYGETGGVFHAKAAATAQVILTVDNVSGNGFEGNPYGWDGVFTSTIKDTSLHEHITDESLLTLYEYSRLCTGGIAEASFVNMDEEPARCVITLTGDIPFNQLTIRGEESLELEKIEISDDGTTWTTPGWTSRKILDAANRFSDYDYVHGSGIIAIKPSLKCRLTFKSESHVSEKLAYQSGEELIFLTNAVRKRLVIHSITATSSAYNEHNTLQSGELLPFATDRIAVIANELVPAHFVDRLYFQYFLTVNGTEYLVQPINSQKDGVKIIKLNKYGSQEASVQLLDETIKTASLRIVLLAASEEETPYLSNVKICYGRQSDV